MQGVVENSAIIEEMLGVERNAGRVLEEAKEKGNQMVLQARSEARRQIEETKEDLQKERDALERRLRAEGKKEVTRIIEERDRAIHRINEKARQQREMALAELREILFGDL
ncbi:MAG: hypothetical protein AB1847_17200 [bacterium]